LFSSSFFFNIIVSFKKIVYKYKQKETKMVHKKDICALPFFLVLNNISINIDDGVATSLITLD